MRRVGRWAAGLGLLLQGCQGAPLDKALARPGASGPSPSSLAANAGPSATPSGTTPSAPPSGGPSLAPPLRPNASASPGLGVPARVHVPLPATLLSGAVRGVLGEGGSQLLANDGLGLIANRGQALLAKDGSSLLANDGGGIISNDGGGIISNDGGGIISNDGGGYRLGQARPPSNASLAIALLLQLSAVKPTPTNMVDAAMLLYGAQAIYVGRSLEALGRQRWTAGQPSGFMLRLPLPGGAQDQLYANVLATPGPQAGQPILWVYDVRNHAKPGDPFPEVPLMAVRVTGPGQGHAVWRPRLLGADPEQRFAFATRFNLPQEEASADLILTGPQGQLRRLALDFQAPRSAPHLRFRSAFAILTQGPGLEGSAFRRMALDVDREGQGRAGAQVAPFGAGTWPLDAAFRWLQNGSGDLGDDPTFHSLQGGLLQGPIGEGPAPQGEGALGFGTRQGPLQVEAPPSSAFDAAFDWPGPLPTVQGLQVDITADMRADMAGSSTP